MVMVMILNLHDADAAADDDDGNTKLRGEPQIFKMSPHWGGGGMSHRVPRNGLPLLVESSSNPLYMDISNGAGGTKGLV